MHAKESPFDLKINLQAMSMKIFYLNSYFCVWNSETWNRTLKKTQKEFIHSVTKWPRSTQKKKDSHRKFCIFNKNYKFVQFLNIMNGQFVPRPAQLSHIPPKDCKRYCWLNTCMYIILYNWTGHSCNVAPIDSDTLHNNLTRCSLGISIYRG